MEAMTERMVVVGGDAAGMSAASQAKRLRGDTLEVVAFERGAHSSYSACGIPYWVAGDVPDGEQLVARTPEAHRANGIDLRMLTDVEAIDLEAGTVAVRDLASGRHYREGFDHLVLATGAVPVRPPLPGCDATGVFGVQTLDDGAALLAGLERLRPKRAVVIGGGYIGVEMAEALARRQVAVTVVDRSPQPMSTLDPDMGELVHQAMEQLGIDVHTDTAVSGFDTDGHGQIRSVQTSNGAVQADAVVLGLGVRPNTALADQAGLPVGDHGGIRTDMQMRVLGHDQLWAGGDCVEVLNLVSGQYQHIPLGTHANKHGRVIGHNIGGSYATFPGVVGTAMSKLCNLEIARTGLSEREATQAGFGHVTVSVQSGTRAAYFPGAQRLTVKMIAERHTGRLLGTQIVGSEGSAKRIDTAATSLWNHMTVEEMTALDLAYAPPFSPVWDPILVAARQASAAVRAAA
ncbi:MAG TPA: FAD-dependent oxidoreductase [Jatrophihabitantaceae bacterium]|nr:FAD-dependent oxidoreductase [Jatrophihabitantaceae bacterium]